MALSGGFSGRKALHLVGVAFPVIYLVLPSGKFIIVSALLALSILSLSLDALRLSSQGVNAWFVNRYGHYLKEEERRGLTGLGPFILSSALTILFFPGPIALAALFFLSLGDLSASLVGRRWGVPRIAGKSLEGTGACFVTCLIIGIIGLPLKLALLGALAAALTELLSGLALIDDNLSIPLVAGTVMTLAG